MTNKSGWHIFWLCAGAVCTYALFRNVDVLKTVAEAVNDYLKGR